MIRDRLVVQIEPLVDDVAPSGGFLCVLHADRMTVPRDWVIDDLRDPQPRLFRGRQEPGDTPRRSTRRHRSPAVESEQLQFSDDAPSMEIDQGESPSSTSATSDAEVVTAVLPPLSPLLDRAFRGTRLEH
jgi:hypothetical protein